MRYFNQRPYLFKSEDGTAPMGLIIMAGRIMPFARNLSFDTRQAERVGDQ